MLNRLTGLEVVDYTLFTGVVFVYQNTKRARDAVRAKQEERVAAACSCVRAIINTPGSAKQRLIAAECKVLSKAFHGSTIHPLPVNLVRKLDDAIIKASWGKAPINGRERNLSLLFTQHRGGELMPGAWMAAQSLRSVKRVLDAHAHTRLRVQSFEFMNFSVMAEHLDLILDHIDMTEVGHPDQEGMSYFMWYV